MLDTLAEDEVEELVDDENGDVVEDELVLLTELELEDVVVDVKELDVVRKVLKEVDKTVVEFELDVTITGNVVKPELVCEEVTTGERY